MRDPTTPAVRQLLEGQHGLVARRQALEAGLTTAQIKYLLASNRWEQVHPGVYGVPGHRPSWHRDLWAGWLHAGPSSVLSFCSAARLHTFEQVRAGRVELAVADRRRHPPEGVVWHRLDDLAPQDVVQLHGLPVTSAARTAVDVSAVLHVASLRLLVDQGIVERRFTVEEVGATLARLRRKGKPGVARMCKVLDDLGPGDAIVRSKLERHLDRVIRLAGLPAPVKEHPLPGRGSRKGFVDRCWPEARLIVEGDGRRWHTRRQQIGADHDRSLQAQAVGYDTTRLLWEHVVHDAEDTARLLRAVYDRRLALLRGELRTS